MITPLTPLSLNQGPRWTHPEEPQDGEMTVTPPEEQVLREAGWLARLLRAVGVGAGWRQA